MAYPYGQSESGRYVLSRDGKEVLRGTEQECWEYLHRTHGFSVDHALTHEGYAMEPER